MANLNMLEHQLPSESNLETRLAEAARASASSPKTSPSVRLLQSFMRLDGFTGHRKNILDSRLTSVGIAAVHGQGGLFAVEDFSQSVPELSVEQQEQKWFFARNEGIPLCERTEEARRTCQSDVGLTGNSAKLMIRFEASDLNKLPEDIERKIRSGPYSKVAVGACRANAATGFSHYRIAVLLF